MLVLSRHRDESIIIGDDIVVTIVDIRGDKVRLGINAPQDVPVHRQEVYDAIQREKTLKHWPRDWRINLIERENPHWTDLFVGLQKYEPKLPTFSALGEMGPRNKSVDDT